MLDRDVVVAIVVAIPLGILHLHCCRQRFVEDLCVAAIAHHPQTLKSSLTGVINAWCFLRDGLMFEPLSHHPDINNPLILHLNKRDETCHLEHLITWVESSSNF